MSDSCKEKVVLPHHEQQELCTTRLPYRQGRKLTAVKVYTINNESNHLLIFGVPSLNLRQEVKSLFARFGKLLQFNITNDHPAEIFTETYHAKYERIQSARVAKRMVDAKNFYGGSLHVCYAPEFESIDEARRKIFKRRQDVLFRLRNLDAEVIEKKSENKEFDTVIENNEENKRTMNMGEENTIIVCKKKRKNNKMQPVPIINEITEEFNEINESNFNDRNFTNNKPSCSKVRNVNNKNSFSVNKPNLTDFNDKSDKIDDLSKLVKMNDVEIVDFTSTEKEVLTNINASLNYDKFGNEVIKKIPYKPLNKIIFNINNKK